MRTRPARRRRAPEPEGIVRLEPPGLPSPFAPGRDVVFARLRGAEPDRVGLRDGDHVALVRRGEAADGELVSVVGRDGRESLRRVPDAPRDPTSPDVDDVLRPLRRHPRLRGVVVGILRKFSSVA